MTIRAKLYAAIVMTILGPVITIAVALQGMGAMDARFDDVEDRAARQALALAVKFAVTDLNGWQTAYGYDNGRSRPRFEQARTAVERDLVQARRELTDERERTLVDGIGAALQRFLAIDDMAYAALQRGDRLRVRRLFLGPEIRHFESMAAAAQELATYEARQAGVARAGFNDERRNARRRLIAVGLGAGVLIVLLLITAQDVARAALESRRERPADREGAPPSS